MKKFTASYILAFIGSQITFWLSFVLQKIANPIEYLNWLIFLQLAFSVFVILLRFSACRELEPLNLEFRKLYKFYWGLLGLTVLNTAVYPLVFSPIYSALLDIEQLSLALFLIYQLATWLFSTAMPLLTILVEWKLIKGIRKLGKGKVFGHKALRIAWYAVALYGTLNIVKGLFLAVGDARWDYSFATRQGSFITMVLSLRDVEAIYFSVWGISGWMIISWAISLAFILALARVTIKLEKIKKEREASISACENC